MQLIINNNIPKRYAKVNLTDGRSFFLSAIRLIVHAKQKEWGSKVISIEVSILLRDELSKLD